MPLDDQGADGPAPSTIRVVEPDILVGIVIASYLRFSEVRLHRKVNGFGLARLIREHYSDVDVIFRSRPGGRQGERPL